MRKAPAGRGEGLGCPSIQAKSSSKSAPKSQLEIGVRRDGSTRFAAIDPQAHHVVGAIAETRLAAWLAPFRSRAEARAALRASGCIGGASAQ